MSDIIPFPRSKDKLIREIKQSFNNNELDQMYDLFEDFEKHQVKLLTKTKVIEIKNDCIKAANGDGELTIPCDYVILATGAKPNPFDVSELTAHNIDIHLVGDCNEKAADINNAITQGYLAANSI